MFLLVSVTAHAGVCAAIMGFASMTPPQVALPAGASLGAPTFVVMAEAMEEAAAPALQDAPEMETPAMQEAGPAPESQAVAISDAARNAANELTELVTASRRRLETVRQQLSAVGEELAS